MSTWRVQVISDFTAGIAGASTSGTATISHEYVQASNWQDAVTAASPSVTLSGGGYSYSWEITESQKTGQNRSGQTESSPELSIADAFDMDSEAPIIAVEDGGTGPGQDDHDFNDGYWQLAVTPVDKVDGECDCQKAGTTSSSQNANAGGSGQPGRATSGMVDPFDGGLANLSTDLNASGFGNGWSQSRSWTNNRALPSDGRNGSGVLDTRLPRLIETGTSAAQIVLDGSNSRMFSQSGGSYTARFFGQDTLTRSGSGSNDAFRWTDTNGQITTFYGSNVANLGGKLKSFTDAAGQTTTANYDGSGYLTSITRQRTISGNTYYESFTYSYDGNNRVSSVVLERKVNAGAWGTVRSVDYTYYDGTTSNGNDGDLHTAVIKDSSGNPLDTWYYRYYAPVDLGSLSTGSASAGLKTATATLTSHGLSVGDHITLIATDPADVNLNGTFVVALIVDADTFTFKVSASAPSSATGTVSMIVNGYRGGLKFVLDPASYARLVANAGSADSQSDATVAQYANDYFQYDSRGYVSKHVSQGAGCSCGGGLGEYLYSYATSTNNRDYNAWYRRGIEVLPDGNQNVIYTNGYGQTMLKVYQDLAAAKSISSITHSGSTVTVTSNGHGYSTNDVVVIRGASVDAYNGIFTITGVTSNTFTYSLSADPKSNPNLYSATVRKVTQQWGWFTKYDSAGRVVLTAQPSAVSLPSNIATMQQYSDLLHATSGNYQYLADDTGLVRLYDYYGSTSTNIAEATAATVSGYLQDTKLQRGENTNTTVLTLTQDYFKRTNGQSGTNTVTVYPLAHSTVYRNTDGTGGQTTTYGYSWFSGYVQTESISVSRPAVTSGQNGSGSADVETSFFDTDGRMIWNKDADGFISYNAFDAVTGGLTKQITDVDTTQTSDFANKPSGWTTPSGGGLHLINSMELDSLGRTTKVTDPKGNISYTVYRDFVDDGGGNNQGPEVRYYRGFDGTNTTGPIQISRTDRPGSYTESILLSGSPSLTSGRPDGTESIDASYIQSLSRQHINAGGQLDYADNYFSLAGQSYTTGTSLGSEGSEFLRTRFKYDDRGRQVRVLRPDTTVVQTFFDGLGRETSRWIGTDDVPSSDINGDGNIDWEDFHDNVISTGSAPAGVNMVKVSESIYDGGGVGDSNLTQSKSMSGTNASEIYTTTNQYDFRDRLTDTRGPDGVAVKYTLDNLGQATRVDTYADADTDFVVDSTELRGRTDSSYDEQGRVYSSTVYNVDPSSGSVGHGLASNTWYNGRGMAVKVAQANGLFNKTAYDGAGRVKATYLSFDISTGTNEATFANAQNVTGDQVIEQVKTIYDKAGNVVTTTTYGRLESDTSSTGELGAATNQAWIQVGVNWYDRANRLTGSANYGRDNGSTRYVFNSSGALIDSNANGLPDEAENSARSPNSSDDYIAASYSYDDAGRPFATTDNLGHVSQNYYDLMGRKTKLIENVQGTNITQVETDTDKNRTTEYLFDSATGNLSKQRAWNPKGSGNGIEYQDTLYLYESDFDRSWVTNTIYPDSSDTTSSGTDQVKTVYDRLGRVTQTTDQNGTVHQFEYDSAGRFYADKVTTLSTNIDGAVRRIEKTYDDLSRVQYVTSRSGTASGSSIVNQVKTTYDGWGNVSKSEQNHGGAVGAGTLSVQYGYDDGAGAGTNALFVRLTSITYPQTNRAVYYNYGSTNNASYYLNRIDSISSDSAGSNKYAQYSYIGSNTIVKVTHPQVSGGLVLSYGASGTYAGWDRFGRILKQEWTNDAVSAIRDGSVYTYDRNSNRLTRDATSTGAPSNIDEQYSYDGLDRLSLYKRGTLASGSISGTNIAFTQDWGGGTNSAILDSQGNWQSWNNNGTSQTRTHDAANETTAVTQSPSDWIDPTYDAAGNMVSFPKGGSETTRLWFVYDAWNRAVALKNDSSGSPGTTAATYAYDGLGRRITKTIGGHTYDGYYNENWQYLETRVDGASTNGGELIWDIRYVDAPLVLGDGVTTDKYYTTDANFNITAIVNASTGSVSERYGYDPYGKVTFYTSAWGITGSSAGGNPIMFGGYVYDGESGLYLARARYYHPTLGKWCVRDSEGYLDGPNLYQYTLSNPSNGVDPSGLLTEGRPVSLQKDTLELSPPSIEPLFRLRTKWTLHSDDRNKNGELIQHVSYVWHVHRCDDGMEDEEFSSFFNFDFYESWYVGGSFRQKDGTNRQIDPDTLWIPFQGQPQPIRADNWLIDGRLYSERQHLEGTYGTVEIIADAKFIETNEHIITSHEAFPAKDLPSTLRAPNGWKDEGATHRHIWVQWCHCSGKGDDYNYFTAMKDDQTLSPNERIKFRGGA